MNFFVKKQLNEDLTKADIKQEVKTVLNSRDIKDIIEKMVTAELKKNKELEDKVVEITGNVLTQFHKVLWTKRGFWKSGLSNKSA